MMMIFNMNDNLVRSLIKMSPTLVLQPCNVLLRLIHILLICGNLKKNKIVEDIKQQVIEMFKVQTSNLLHVIFLVCKRFIVRCTLHRMKRRGNYLVIFLSWFVWKLLTQKCLKKIAEMHIIMRLGPRVQMIIMIWNHKHRQN